MSRYRKFTTICCAAALAFGLAACGGGDDETATVMPPPPPPPTPYEMALDNIADAATEADAQAAYDAVKDDVTAAQGETLQMRVNARIAAIQMAARTAEQKMALMTAAGMIDTSDLSTQALVDAARTAIAGLRQALDDADDVSDADKGMYMSQLTGAVDAVDMAQGGIDTATRRMNQMTALSDASGTLQTALAALSGSTPTQAQLDAANNALTALNGAITGGADLTDTEKAPYQREADNAAAPIQTAQMAFDDAEDDAEDARNAAMAVTASKLYAGIGAYDTTAGAELRNADYSGTSDANITVSYGATPTTQDLTEDDDAMVADHHGWTGKMYTASSPSVGTYEAVVYSNVGEPVAGDSFNDQYTLDATTGEVTIDTTSEDTPASRVASSQFDHTAGAKEFELGTNMLRVMIAGSYHGVAGTYNCTPAAPADCSATVATSGFTLGGGVWTFKPGDPEAKVMSTPDANYASYGWWIHKAANDGAFTASVFVADKGTGEGAAANVDTLLGTATYTGGAAGKYALRSSTGGTNDAGHFTADAKLDANFNTDMIEGTISNFTGADGQSRDWVVKLNETDIGTTGEIDGTNADGDEVGTVWTIGETAADAGGEWSGALYNNDETSNVPQVATGTFHSTYGEAGQMVGAFGANN